jgi:16S rRNA (cytosine967-C5)-methyltransferase
VRAKIAPHRQTAYNVVRRVFEQDAWADRAFPAEAERHGLDQRRRSQAQRLAYGAVQRRGTADHLIATLARRSPDRLDPPVLAALRLGVYELLWSSGAPNQVVVHQAVELAKRGIGADRRAARRRADAAAGLVNAVLRRAAREGTALLEAIDSSTPAGAALLHSYPEWLVTMWWQEIGPDGARSLMAAMNEPAETALRVNPLRTDPERAIAELVATESVERPVSQTPLAPTEAVVVRGPLSDEVRRRMAAGELVAQARASQAVVSLLDPRPGERVLDLCAAPGIKTTAIAGRMRDQGEIVAVESDPGRAGRLRELCARLGATCVRVVEADARSFDLSGGYDRILVDPPCSDLGTLASRPDARWRKSPALIERVEPIQASILARAARALGSGTLVYATCTISGRENEHRINELEAADAQVRCDDLGASYPELASRVDGRTLQTRPDRDGTDGFFIARLRRARHGVPGGS